MTLVCPRCSHPLVGRSIGDVVVHECADCEGVYLDEHAIGIVLKDATNQCAEALVAALPRRPHQVLPGNRRMYVKCPTCSTVMNRKLFAAGSGVVVDVCRSHGTFFDAGELPAIIDFVMAGGLAQAPRKPSERPATRVGDDTLANELAMARVVRTHGTSTYHVDIGDAFLSLLFELFG